MNVKFIKKFLGLCLVGMLTFTYNSVNILANPINSNEAIVSEGDMVGEDDIVSEEYLNTLPTIESTYFLPDGRILTKAEFNKLSRNLVPHGTVNIEDKLDTSEGSRLHDYPEKSFTNTNAFKNTMVSIISYVPGIGQYVEKGSEILSMLQDLDADLKMFIGTSKPLYNTNFYSTRNFHHKLSVWNEYTQKCDYVGYSKSKYYYKHSEVRYFNTSVNEWRTSSESFTHANGYGPATIAKAPNYMNRSMLSRLAHDRWVEGNMYYETY